MMALIMGIGCGNYTCDGYCRLASFNRRMRDIVACVFSECRGRVDVLWCLGIG
jgi:hypothetical protein